MFWSAIVLSSLIFDMPGALLSRVITFKLNCRANDGAATNRPISRSFQAPCWALTGVQEMGKTLNASEALFGFAGWLTSREERTVMSSSDDCAVIADLIDQFCKANSLPEVSPEWAGNLIHPSGEIAVSGIGKNEEHY